MPGHRGRGHDTPGGPLGRNTQVTRHARYETNTPHDDDVCILRGSSTALPGVRGAASGAVRSRRGAPPDVVSTGTPQGGRDAVWLPTAPAGGGDLFVPKSLFNVVWRVCLRICMCVRRVRVNAIVQQQSRQQQPPQQHRIVPSTSFSTNTPFRDRDRALIRDAERFMGGGAKVKRAVVAVPAYFNPVSATRCSFVYPKYVGRYHSSPANMLPILAGTGRNRVLCPAFSLRRGRMVSVCGESLRQCCILFSALLRGCARSLRVETRQVRG